MQSSKPFQKSRDKLLEMADHAAAKPENMTREETNYALAKPTGEELGLPEKTFSAGEEMPNDIIEDSGGWSYKDLGGGRVQIMSAPPGSKAAGKVLDPGKIATIADPKAKARAERAYASIQNLISGGGKPAAGASSKAPPNQDMLGGERAPVASSGRAPDPSAGAGTPGFANAVIPTGRGPAINRGDAPGPGAIDTATAPPARSFKSAPYRH